MKFLLSVFIIFSVQAQEPVKLENLAVLQADIENIVPNRPDTPVPVTEKAMKLSVGCTNQDGKTFKKGQAGYDECLGTPPKHKSENQKNLQLDF